MKRLISTGLTLGLVLALMGGTAAAQSTAAEQVTFLQHAPEGTWAALNINGQKLAASTTVQNMMMMSGQDTSELDKMGSFTLYALPLEGPIGPGMKFPFCGVIRVSAEAEAAADEQLAAAGAEKVTVDGMEAYRLEAGKVGAMAGAQVPPDAQQFSVLVAKGGEGRFLVGSDEGALRAVKAGESNSSSAALPGLSEAVGSRADNAICLAAFVEGGLKTMIPPEEVGEAPPFVQNMRGAGIGLDMGAGLDLQAELLTGSNADASTILAMIQGGIAQARQQLTTDPGMAQLAPQITPMIDKVNVEAKGSSVLLGFSVTEAEIGQLMMMAMMMGSMAGGGPGGAGAPGGGMPGGMGGF